MKKYFIKSTLVLFLLLFSMFGKTTFAVDSSIIATCGANYPGFGYYALMGTTPLLQSIVPGVNRIDKVQVPLFSLNADSITIGISSDSSGLTILGSSSTTITPSQYQYYTADFTDIEVNPNSTYYVFTKATNWPRADHPGWAFSTDTSCYGFGSASTPLEEVKDFGFKVYGYNYTAPAVETSSAPTSTTSSTTNSTTGDAPATTTSSSINKPNSAKIALEADNKTVKLTWTKSTTTDIDGYKIYRSEEKTKNFKSIGKTDNKTVEYLDATAEAGKTYYYFIRSYKGTSESASSDTLTIQVPQALADLTASPTVSPSVETSPVTTTPVEEKQFPWAIAIGSGVVIIGILGFGFWKFVLPKIKAKKSIL